MARLALALIFVAGVLSHAFAEDPEKLVGARNASPGQFPYVVSLRMFGQHVCGGSILDHYHILTAAHCVKALKNNLYIVSVVSGSIFLNQGGHSYGVADMWTHPDYDGEININNDIGVIKLAEPISYNSFQKPISLPTQKPAAGSVALISAWGKISKHGGVSNVLQYLYLNVLDLNTCKRYHELDVSNTAICTFDGRGKGLCNGDSGSPLAYKGQVVGVVSRGIPCAEGYPDVFTSVYDTLSFVREAMNM